MEDVMDTNEKYIRDRWELVHCCDGSYLGYARGTVLLQDSHRHWIDFDSWSAAKAFTVEREGQIAEIEEEIAWLTEQKRRLRPTSETQTAKEMYAVSRRILAVEQERLVALKQGMK
jgi:hypothetical protein